MLAVSAHTGVNRYRQCRMSSAPSSGLVPTRSAEEGTAVRDTLEQIDSIKRFVKERSDSFEIAYSTNDIARINMDGKFASLIGLEGGNSFDNSLSVLRMLRDLGTRYVTLTVTDNLDDHNSSNGGPKYSGFQPFAEQLVKEMNRLGMLVDTSHLPIEAMKHVVQVSRTPVIASNVPGTGLAASEHKVPDDVVALIKKSGGVIMVNFYSILLPARASDQERFV